MIEGKEDFDNAYEMLCEKLYLTGGVYYKELDGINKEAEEIRDKLLDVKIQIDDELRYFCGLIYSKLKIKYEK